MTEYEMQIEKLKVIVLCAKAHLALYTQTTNTTKLSHGELCDTLRPLFNDPYFI